MHWRTENVLTVGITAALVFGLYALGAGGWSFVALALLSNINSRGSE